MHLQRCGVARREKKLQFIKYLRSKRASRPYYSKGKESLLLDGISQERDLKAKGRLQRASDIANKGPQLRQNK